jgi:hypothetical protein
VRYAPSALSTVFHKYDCVLKSLPTSLYKREENTSPFMKGGKAAGPDRPLARRGIFSRNEIETQSAEYVTVFTDMGTKPYD